MEADRSLYVKDPLRDFTREGTFSFRRTMLFMTQMESHSTNREINDFFLSLGRPVTQSAGGGLDREGERAAGTGLHLIRLAERGTFPSRGRLGDEGGGFFDFAALRAE